MLRCVAVAKLSRDAAEERVRELEGRPGAAGSQAVEEIVGTLEAELLALQAELKKAYPFGPAMVAGALLGLSVGEPLVSGLFGT